MPILPISSISQDDELQVGAKAVSLGQLSDQGIPVPKAFVVPAQTYDSFLEHNRLTPTIEQELSILDRDDPESIQRVSHRLQQHIIGGKLHQSTARSIFSHYDQLVTKTFPHVALRTSLISPHLHPGESPLYLHIKGEATVVELIKEIWAHLFSAHHLAKWEHPLVHRLAVIVQQMVPATTSGFAHTRNPDTQDKTQVMIEAIWGYGEYLVQQYVKPDIYLLDRTNLKQISHIPQEQQIYLTLYRDSMAKRSVPPSKQSAHKLSKQLQKRIAKLALKTQQIRFFPQTIEWAAHKNTVYVLQAEQLGEGKRAQEVDEIRPDVSNQTDPAPLNLPHLVTGRGLFAGKTWGHIKLISHQDELENLHAEDIVVLQQLSPSAISKLTRVKGLIIANNPTINSIHLLAHDLQIPTIAGIDEAFSCFTADQIVTLDGSNGTIYQGRPGVDQAKIISEPKAQPSYLPKKLKTQLWLDLPTGRTPTQTPEHTITGTCMLRGELLISSLHTHPKYLLERNKGDQITSVLTKKIQKLFRKRPDLPVLYRISDFTSELLLHLTYAKAFEEPEPNPRIGLRGMFRHLLDTRLYTLELDVIAQLKDTHPITAVLPFVRSVEELEESLKIAHSHNSKQFDSNSLWLELATPGACITLPQLIRDEVAGYVVNLSLLSELALGIDRQNQSIHSLYTQADPSITWLISHVAKYTRKHNKELIVLGEAPAKYPHITQQLITAGVTGFATTADLHHGLYRYTATAEKKMQQNTSSNTTNT